MNNQKLVVGFCDGSMEIHDWQRGYSLTTDVGTGEMLWIYKKEGAKYVKIGSLEDIDWFTISGKITIK